MSQCDCRFLGEMANGQTKLNKGGRCSQNLY